MRTVIAHITGFVAGIIVLMIYCNIAYGGLEARPGWTTIIGIGVWWFVAGAIKNTGKITKAEEPASTTTKEN